MEAVVAEEEVAVEAGAEGANVVSGTWYDARSTFSLFRMPMLLNQLSLVAIGASVLLSMGLGFLWFSPMLFVHRWLRLSKIDTGNPEHMQKAMLRCLAISVVTCITMAVIFAALLQLTHIATTIGAIKLAVVLWTGFIATTFGTNYAYTGKPLELFFIDTGYPLVSLVVIAVTLTTIG